MGGGEIQSLPGVRSLAAGKASSPLSMRRQGSPRDNPSRHDDTGALEGQCGVERDSSTARITTEPV